MRHCESVISTLGTIIQLRNWCQHRFVVAFIEPNRRAEAPGGCTHSRRFGGLCRRTFRLVPDGRRKQVKGRRILLVEDEQFLRE